MQIVADPSAQAAIAAELQSILRTNPRFKLEFLAAMSRLFREHDIYVEPEVLSHLTLAMNGGPGAGRGSYEGRPRQQGGQGGGRPGQHDGPPPESRHHDGPPPESRHHDGPPPESRH